MSSSEKNTLHECEQNRIQQPKNSSFRTFIGEDWAPRTENTARMEVADFTPARRMKLASSFIGERLVIPAGEPKVRANDTDYRFRAHSTFAHLTGLGAEHEPSAVLVLHPIPPEQIEEGGHTHEAVLYFHPCASRSSEEFYADSRHGEFWVGARPTAQEMSAATGLKVKHSDCLRSDLAKDLGNDEGCVHIRVIPHADESITSLVQELRAQNSLPTGSQAAQADNELARAASELRLIKDSWEIEQMKQAVAVTAEGFEAMIASLPQAVQHWRGERVLEGVFGAKAREEGNGLGYETIVASGNHANTLHWTRNDGSVEEGDLILIDAGAELDSLYTADITRTIPVNGHFTHTQRQVYEAVLDACEAALEEANRPGARFKDVHHAAMRVIAEHLDDWGILPVSAEESLMDDGGQYHRRWMPHGTSHHLGIDVHDCAQAKRELYQDAVLEPGMVFTIEPGLYFRKDDMKVPERFRGIGVRIEDDIAITDQGAVRISENIPRTVDDIESWMARLRNSSATR